MSEDNQHIEPDVVIRLPDTGEQFRILAPPTMLPGNRYEMECERRATGGEWRRYTQRGFYDAFKGAE